MTDPTLEQLKAEWVAAGAAYDAAEATARAAADAYYAAKAAYRKALKAQEKTDD